MLQRYWRIDQLLDASSKVSHCRRQLVTRSSHTSTHTHGPRLATAIQYQPSKPINHGDTVSVQRPTRYAATDKNRHTAAGQPYRRTSWWHNGTSDVRPKGREFHFRSSRYQAVTTCMGDCLRTCKPSRYITDRSS